ncbi:MAG: asparagine synthase (glutamine-hydrolyzing) [Geodermatophilaceae bacterium]|nr:asparagine synthase (glutamine-hydrolyzing) [Geodermatophilaceae bacterium]
MCGIAGEMRFDGQPVTAERMAAMTSQLQHRGPDGEGHWLGATAGFGHSRLAIIDVAGSAQPMASRDGRYVVTFNGEIFNYRSLRRELDYPFATDGDTEVLLALFDSAGPAGVQRLRGQFAYAIYDTFTGELHLFRDRLGILPLYYTVDDDRLLFASEIKALLAVVPNAAVDVDSLHDYLGRRSVLAPYTLFDGIRKLLPGHRLLVRPGGAVEVHQYWSVPNESVTTPIEPGEAIDRVEEALTESVRDALVADVPVGAYLSGGLDSSLIVALATSVNSGAQMRTYSAGFSDPRFDELPWARRVSQLLHTEHHEVTIGPSEFIDLWRPLTWHRDAPMSEPADVAVHKLAVLAGQDVKVVLSGEGSDELFAGYPKYRMATTADVVGMLPSRIRGPVLTRLDRALPAALGRLTIPVRAMAATSREQRLRTWFAPFTDTERQALLGPPRRHAEEWFGPGRGDAVRRMLYADTQGWLPDNLLERGDRMSMSASVELRPPFLDARVVELAFGLPSAVKLRRGTTKWVVKEVARRHLPTEIVDRRKVGFAVPLDAWFRDGLRDMAWDMLTSTNSYVGEIMAKSAIQDLLSSHDSGRRNEHIRLWTLLGLEVWHELFFRSAPTGA